jgi:hypothetical protein
MSLSRVRSLAILGALVLIAVVVVTWTLLSDKQSSQADGGHSCPPGAKPANTTMPKEQAVKLNVYSSTDRAGLAGSTATKLKAVGFHVVSTKQDPTGTVVKGSAQIRFGRKAVGAAQLMRAYVPGATMQYDPGRETDTVDLVLGEKFEDIRGPSDVKEAEVTLGDPTPPPGTC